MKSTPAYEARYHGATNKPTDAAAECAVWNVDAEEQNKALCERVDKAVSRLSKKEKEIIEKRYVEDGRFDYLVAGDVGLSERTYTRMKARAFYKLVFMLKLEVLTEDPDLVLA